jgi:hypothetical protein
MYFSWPSRRRRRPPPSGSHRYSFAPDVPDAILRHPHAADRFLCVVIWMVELSLIRPGYARLLAPGAHQKIVSCHAYYRTPLGDHHVVILTFPSPYAPWRLTSTFSDIP